MEKTIHIVPAKDEHLEFAGNIAVKAWQPIRQEYRKILGDCLYETFFDNWQTKKRKSVENSLKKGRGFVALVDNDVAGFISYSIDEITKTGEILENAVDPQFRGMGIGTMMYEFVMEKMREEGMFYAVVTTGGDDAHAPARRSYERAGFEKFLPSVKYFKSIVKE